MSKLEKIGAGRDAEVFLWEENKILKLYFKHVSSSRIDYEFKVNKIINDKLVNTPKAYEMIEKDGRTSIVFEFAKGKPLSQQLQEEIARAIEYSKISLIY